MSVFCIFFPSTPVTRYPLHALHGLQVCHFEEHTKEIYTIQWSPTGPGSANPNKSPMLARYEKREKGERREREEN